VHGRRVHGRRVHGRSAVSDDGLDLSQIAYGGPEEDVREAPDPTRYGGISELLLATLLAAQAAQIQHLMERVARLELAD